MNSTGTFRSGLTQSYFKRCRNHALIPSIVVTITKIMISNVVNRPKSSNFTKAANPLVTEQSDSTNRTWAWLTLFLILFSVIQQDGFAHAGFGWSLGDSAAGYAAFSLMAPGERVLTVEMKINLLRPAAGDTLRATGRVLRFGRTLCTAASELHVLRDGTAHHIATMLGTMSRQPAR